tara:strand:- start:32 stop:421 length:390 start_codon:yes stop_codon:yes gene_type:complete
MVWRSCGVVFLKLLNPSLFANKSSFDPFKGGPLGLFFLARFGLFLLLGLLLLLLILIIPLVLPSDFLVGLSFEDGVIGFGADFGLRMESVFISPEIEVELLCFISDLFLCEPVRGLSFDCEGESMLHEL